MSVLYSILIVFLHLLVVIFHFPLWLWVLRNGDARRKTEQPYLLATVLARRLSLFSHILRMSDESCAKQILTASPLKNWRRLLGHHRTMYSNIYLTASSPKPHNKPKKPPGWAFKSSYHNCFQSSVLVDVNCYFFNLISLVLWHFSWQK